MAQGKMADIQFNRAGLSGRDPVTGLRLQVSRLRNGEQRLTARGRALLSDPARFPGGWMDYMISIPTTERQKDTGAHPVGPPRDVYTTFSEGDYPGMEAILASHLPPGTNLAQYLLQPGAVLPPAFKAEFLQLVDVDGDGVVQAGSDRDFVLRDGPWHVSTLRMEGVGNAARLVADLDRPMNGTVLVYEDIPCNWALDPLAFTEKDCVALQLADRMQSVYSYERIKRDLDQLSPTEGYTTETVKAFLDQMRARGHPYGYRIIREERVLYQEPASRDYPCIQYCQSRGHMYMFEKGFQGLNNLKKTCVLEGPMAKTQGSTFFA